MTIKHKFNSELAALFSVENWRMLAKHICDFRPDVVVLIARKMPRLAEVLQLHFGDHVVVISDLAIPFCHRIIHGKRVAIVDDVINYGSTMNNARTMIQACGASAYRLFALAAKDHSNSMDLPDFWLVSSDHMNESKYKDFVRQVPAALQLVSKPYDMDYPLFNCIVRPPFNSGSDVYGWFHERFGNRLHVLTTEREQTHGLSRLSVDFSEWEGTYLKARFYFDFNSGECNVVPMVIPAHFSNKVTYDRTTWAGAVWATLIELLGDAPIGTSLWREEPLARAELFVHSLAFARRVLSETNEVVTLGSALPFSHEDAILVFGPEVVSIILEMNEERELQFCDLDKEYFKNLGVHCTKNPFRDNLPAEELTRIEQNGNEMIEKGDLAGAFHSIFEGLAIATGATDANHYSLSWPFSSEEIVDKPYLRLRIGFTFKDLVSFFEPRISRFLRSSLSAQGLISAFLDHYIDSGSLVPAIANYGGVFYRIYRKGENNFWDEETNRTLYALKCLNEPLSLTRLAKLQAILSFTSEVSTTLVPEAFERGYVGVLPPSVVDRSGAEFGRFLLRIGKLKVS